MIYPKTCINSGKDNRLVVSPCTKRMGIAIFSGNELIYFAVKTLKSPRTAESIRKQVSVIMGKLAVQYKPKLLIIKSLGKHQAKSKNLRRVSKRIKRAAIVARIPLREVSFEAAKKRLCPGAKPTKTAAFRSLSNAYPELKQFLNRPGKWQKEYYDSLLSAAAVGVYYQNKNARRNFNRIPN